MSVEFDNEKMQLSIVIGVITNENGEIFLTQRNQPGTKEHEKWEFPGGKIEFGEDPESAMVREVKEETGFDVQIVRLLPKVYTNVYLRDSNHPGYDLHILLIAYHCKIVGGEFKTIDEEILSGRFFKKNEVDYANSLEYTKEIIDLLDK